MHFLEYTLSHRGKCVQPAGASGNIRWFVPETHARSEKQRIELTSKLFFAERASASFAFVLPRRRQRRERRQRRLPPRRQRVNGRGKFRGKSPRHLARENIAWYPSWTLIKSGLRGVSSSRYGLSRWVTQGSTAPGGALASSSVIRRAGLWRRLPPLVVFAIRL